MHTSSIVITHCFADLQGQNVISSNPKIFIRNEQWLEIEMYVLGRSQPTFLLIWHLLLLHLSVDVPFTCPKSWGYYAILENAIEQNRLLTPAVGSEILLWEPAGM